MQINEPIGFLYGHHTAHITSEGCAVFQKTEVQESPQINQSKFIAVHITYPV